MFEIALMTSFTLLLKKVLLKIFCLFMTLCIRSKNFRTHDFDVKLFMKILTLINDNVYELLY